MAEIETDMEPNIGVEESLLYAARNGDVAVVKTLLDDRKDGRLNLDINCKGQSKTNFGWTSLHLATYFGHAGVVRVLLEAGANVDEVNESGDTALHKASFIGNEELILLLLKHNADTEVMNGEGRTALDLCRSGEVQRLLDAARKSARCDRERALLTAAKAGRVDEVQQLLNRPNGPSINCVDAQGNTCLHCAAYRGHAALAILLLQHGINTTVKNHCGQLAIDLARDAEMREVLSVRPVQRMQRTAARFEGPLLKRSRFLGWRQTWAVLQRGVLLYYGNKSEATKEKGEWRMRKYLDGAVVTSIEERLFSISFSDGDTHRLAVPRGEKDPQAFRKNWLTALSEHIEYSGHYLWAGAAPDLAREATELMDENSKPLGSMQDSLNAANNNLSLLENQLRECGTIVTALEKSTGTANSLHQSACMRFQHACGTGAELLAALRHCTALIEQARERDAARLAREIERNRVLEEALTALAKTHHALEMSVAEELTKSKRKKKSSSTLNSSKENFYDVYDNSDDEDATLVTGGACSPLGALSPWASNIDLAQDDESVTPTNERALSRASSRGTLVSHGGHVYRNARGYSACSFYSSVSQ